VGSLSKLAPSWIKPLVTPLARTLLKMILSLQDHLGPPNSWIISQIPCIHHPQLLEDDENATVKAPKHFI